MFLLVVSFASMILFSESPFLASLFLVLSTIFSSAFLVQTSSVWLFFINILLFTGGMMILFTYVTTIYTSKKFFFNSFVLLMISLLISFVGLNPLPSKNTWMSLNPSDMFFSTNSPILALIMGYLLVLLLISMLILTSLKGSLKTPLLHE